MTSRHVGIAGYTATEPDEVGERWRQYIESLHDKDGKPKIEDLQVEEREEVDEDEAGPEAPKVKFYWQCQK